MSLLDRRGLLAGLLILAAPAALAQTTTPPPPQPPGPGAGPGMMGRGPGMMGGPGMRPGAGPGTGAGMPMMADPASYLDGLKTELGITEAQMPAWTAYAETVKGVAGQMQGIRQSMWESMQTATWQERQSMMNAMTPVRQQAHATVHEAALKLLPSLTPTQRQRAQTMLPGLGTGMGRGMGPGQGRGPGMMRGQGAPPG